ncbi:MAG: hypothetical protein M0Z99_13345, partial [Betaproteobacteria bacterium]|nr:hypothetical protein [Betaproteobacteria bacterium]
MTPKDTTTTTTARACSACSLAAAWALALHGMLATETALAGLTNSYVATVTTQSIEVNGKSYAPGSTVTLTNPNITWRVTVGNTVMTTNSTPAAATGYYASLCTDTAACVLDGSGSLTTAPAVNGFNTSNLVSAAVSSGTYQVYYSDIETAFFSVPGHPQQINAQSLGLTFVVVTPAAYGLKSNGGAVSTITANAGVQALTATVTPRSDDVGAAGQLYVAAALPGGALYFKAASGWVQLKSGTLPVYSVVPALAASNA